MTLIIGAIAFVTRFHQPRLSQQAGFDETYYPKTILPAEVRLRTHWPSDANSKIIAGNPMSCMTPPLSWVHPPFGKWLIAGGEYLFGMNAFGWRFASLVFGTLLIMVTIRLVRRVSKSTVIGGLAGILLTFDGLEFVMSRTALLDIFPAFFVIAAVSCLVADREWFRNRLASHLEHLEIPDLGGHFGPALVLRPWRLAAGVCFGLALGSKWNALYPPAAFACFRLPGTLERDALPAPEHARSSHSFGMAFRPSFLGSCEPGGVPRTWASWLDQRRLRPRLGRQHRSTSP